MNKSKLFTKKIPYYGHFDVVVLGGGRCCRIGCNRQLYTGKHQC